MKKYLLIALMTAAAAVQLSAQPLKSGVEWERYTLDEKTVYMIHDDETTSSNYCLDKDGNAMALPKGIGAMKFIITNEANKEVALYSWTGSQDKVLTQFRLNSYRVSNAITDTTFTGKLWIPSKVRLDTSADDSSQSSGSYEEYTVTEIWNAAFALLPGITEVVLDNPYLKTIWAYAFAQSKKKDSYTKVTINTKEDLVIHAHAFAGYAGTEYIDDDYSSYADENRKCLANVDIKSNGLDIKEDAFGACEALETVDIETTGIINIEETAFHTDGVTTKFEAAGKNIHITKLLPRMWERDGTTDEKGKNDHIYIKGKINTIGSFAFPGHQNIKHIRLIDIRKNNDEGNMTIGTQAFQNAFNGKGVEGTLTIEGPITNIGTGAFWNYLYYNNYTSTDPKTHSDEEKALIENNTYQDCLTHVRITNTGDKPLTTTHFIPDHFVQTKDNTAKATLKIEGLIEKIGYRAAYFFENTKTNFGGSRLREIIIDNKNLSDNPSATVPDMTIDSQAFTNCMSSKLPDIDGTITITGPCQKIGEQAFSNAQNNPGYLTTTKINNTSTTDLTIDKYAFMYQYGKDDTKGTLTIDGPLASIGQQAFYSCKHLHTGTVNNTGTTQTSIGQSAFEQSFGHTGSGYNRHFEDGVFSFTGSLATFGYGSFRNTTGLKTLNITSDSEFTIGAYAFQTAYMLSELNYKCPADNIETTRTLPAKVTSVGAQSFYNTGFTEMTVPSLTLRATSIDTKTAKVDGVKYPGAIGEHDMYNINNKFGYQVFASCNRLERVHFDNSATGYCTFAYCSDLKYVTLGRNVRFIQDQTFYSTDIDTLFIPKEVQVIGDDFLYGTTTRITFENTQPPYAKKEAFRQNGTLHNHYPVVPKGCVSAYLFSADDGGFQNVRNDQISCAYKLSAGQNWGSLGTQAHKIKEYKATFGTVSGETYRLYTLTTSDDRAGEFTDIYDMSKTGIDLFETESSVATTDKPEEEALPSEQNKVNKKAALAQEQAELRTELLNNSDFTSDLGTLTDEELADKYPQYSRYLAIEDELYKLTESIKYAAAAYTADYYYKDTKKVGIDMVQNDITVPQHSSSDTYNIGYLVELPKAGATYFLHHFTGETEKISGSYAYTSAGYNSLLTKGQELFNGEDIPCPGVLRKSMNDGNKTYSRTKAPNILLSWDEDHTNYAQNSDFTFDNGSWFGTKKCYYYGFAQGMFRRIGSWDKFKEGNAFIAIPVELFASEGSDAKATFGLFLNDDDDDDDQGETTGITTVDNRPTNMMQGAWYTLQGIRLESKPTKSGIYIHNGRKEVIK